LEKPDCGFAASGTLSAAAKELTCALDGVEAFDDGA